MNVPSAHAAIRRCLTSAVDDRRREKLRRAWALAAPVVGRGLIGLEEGQDGIWNVIYYETLLGRFDERTRTMTGVPSLKKDC